MTATPSINSLPQDPQAAAAANDSRPIGVWSRLSRRISTMICLGIVGIYLLIGMLAFLPAFENKAKAEVGESYQHPSRAKFDLWLGCDIQGRPVIWRLLYGTRVALLITIFASVLTLSTALRRPAWVGLNEISTTQPEPMATSTPQLLWLMMKSLGSLPLSDAVVTVTGV